MRKYIWSIVLILILGLLFKFCAKGTSASGGQALWSKSGGKGQIANSKLQIAKLATKWRVVKDDFLVNDDITGGCNQTYPDIAGPVDGKFVVVWEDYRNGNDGDIYGGIYDFTGALVKPIFRVNNDTGSASQNTPAVAMDSTGDFVVVWSDSRNGASDIYAQLYDAQGTPVGTDFIINDDIPGEHKQCEPAVAKAKDGDFVVVWRDERNTAELGIDVYAQIYDSNGNKRGEQFIVNDDSAKVTQRIPEIAFYRGEEFAVVWMDIRRGEQDIYCQRFNLSGATIGTNFRVNDDNVVKSQQFFPFISSNYNRIVILWRDNRLSNYPNIFAQLYDSLWNPVDSNFCVNPNRRLSSQGVAEVTSCVIGETGEFIVVWSDETVQISGPDVYFQKFNSAGIPVGDTVRVTETQSDRYSYATPKIIMDESENFIIVWQHNYDGQYDIMMQSYDKNSNPIGQNTAIVPEQGTGSQIESSISMNEDADFVIVWLDKITSGIFAKVYNRAGNPYGASFQLSPDTLCCSQPAVAMDTNGDFVSVWVSGSHIYACKYNISGLPVSSVFQVDSGGGWFQKAVPDVAMDGTGSFVIVWEDHRLDNKCPDIFCQRFSTRDCTPIDTNFMVNKSSGRSSLLPCITMRKNGEFIVVWQEDFSPYEYVPDIIGQKYNSSGNPVAGNFKISEDAAGNIHQMIPAIATRENGAFMVAWVDFRNSSYDIYGQMCDSACELIGHNFKINNNIDNSSQMYPSIAVNPDTGNFIVTWTDYKASNRQITAQLFDSTGQTEVWRRCNFQLNNPDVHLSNQHWSTSKHSIAANNEFFAFTWIDNRRFKGWDIYAKLVSLIEEIEDTLSHKTYINTYPNPGYDKLIVEYEVVKSGKYGIIVYDRAGRELFALPEEEKAIGKYTAELDFSKYSSGVYFVKLKGPESSVSKIAYMKWK